MIVKKAHLQAVLLAAGKKDIRLYLNGVHINGRHLVATDGHRMHVVVHGGDWPHGPVTIPREAVERALKARVETMDVSVDTIGAERYTPLDGTYPDYTRAMLHPGEMPRIGAIRARINPAYLADAEKAVKLAAMKDAILCVIGSGDTYKWAWSGHGCQVVVMGVRDTWKNPKTGETELFTSLEPL